jgi:serine/threonine-protein kinase
MITDEGEVKIVDFGLAKAAHQTQVTKEGSTLGTAAYMSPEQARGESVDERTDQFSLGAVIYEMVTGKPAFGGEYSQAIIYSVLNESPAPLRDLNPDVSPELAGVVDRMLTKAPEERFASVGDAAAELMNLLNRERGLEVVGTADHLFRRIRSPRVAIPVALAVVAIAALFAWLSDRHAKARHAEEVLLPRIDALLETSWSDFIEVYALAEEAESHIPDHPRLLEVFAAAALHIDITTEPAGADV